MSLRSDNVASSARQTEGHVFTTGDGRAHDPAYITRLFQNLHKGPGEELPAMSSHGLRHCAASLTLASGGHRRGEEAAWPCLDFNYG